MADEERDDGIREGAAAEAPAPESPPDSPPGAPPEAPPEPPPGPPPAEVSTDEPSAGDVPAPLQARFFAALIDWVIVIVVGQIPNVGGLAAAAYLLIRDGLETDFMDQRSIGKRIMKIRPVRADGLPLDVTDSIRRNWMFAFAGVVLFLAPSPLGWFFAIPLGLMLLIFLVIETFLVLVDPRRRRFGDRIANTIVIEVDS